MRVLLEAPITYEVPDGIVHCPMVVANVAGTPTKLILDTGSTAHVLTKEFADAVGLSVQPGEPGMDLTGTPVPSWTIGDLSVEIVGSALDLHEVVAAAGPSPFEGWGIGGFLSPQNMAASGYAVLDLIGNTFLVVEGEPDGVSSWLRSRSPSLRLLTLDREPFETIAIRASVEPFDPVAVMLDTGGSGSEFARAGVPGLAGAAPSRLDRGVSGVEIEGEEIPSGILRVEDVTFPLDGFLVREERPPPQGLLGMDVLRGTVLAVSSDPARSVVWQVDTQGAA